MFLKKALITSVILFLVFTFAGSILAQNITEEDFKKAQDKYKQLVEKLKEITKEMEAVESEEAYNKLKSEYDQLSAELTNVKKIINEYSKLNKEISECVKAFSEGRKSFTLRNYDKALQHFSDCINKGLDNIDINSVKSAVFGSYIFRGVIYQNIKRNYDQAIKMFEKAIEVQPERASGYYNLASVYEKIGKIDKSIETYKKTIEVDPEYQKAFYGLAGVYFVNKKDFQKALSFADKAISIDPDYVKAIELAGRALVELKEFDKAIPYFNRVLELDKKNDYYLSPYNLAFIYNNKKEYEQALKYAEQSLEMKKNFGGALLEKGKALKGMGQEQKALEVFNEARKDRIWRPLAEHQINIIKNKENYINNY